MLTLDQLHSAAAVEIINLEKQALQITPNAHLTILMQPCAQLQNNISSNKYFAIYWMSLLVNSRKAPSVNKV